MNFVIVFSNSVKKKILGSLIGMALNMHICLGSMVIFTILAPPTHKQLKFSNCLHLLLIGQKVFCSCVHIIPMFVLADRYLSILYCLG